MNRIKSLAQWLLPILLLAYFILLNAYLYSPIAITTTDVFHALTHKLQNTPYDNIAQRLVIDIRLPRIIIALLTGAILGISGLLMQTITRNPLASPSLLSINAGASLGVILTSAMMTLNIFPSAITGIFTHISLSLAAAIGAFFSWTLVLWISYSDGRIQQNRLILAGVAVSAFCMAIGKVAMILAEDQASGILRWLAGGFSNMTWEKLYYFLPFVILPILPLLWLIPKLNLLRLSDESAQSLGLSIQTIRRMIYGIVLIWVGASVATTGPIAFVGLLIPHISKYIIGYDLRTNIPMCALLGALFLLIADLIATALAYPSQMPAGAVVAIIGAPCFVLLAKLRNAK